MPRHLNTDPERRVPARVRRLGERLVEHGVINEQQLRQALELQKQNPAFLGQILVDLGFVGSDAIGPLLAGEYGVPYVNLLRERIESEVVRLLPENVIRDTGSLPIRLVDNVLHVAMLDPLNVAAIDRIHQATGYRVTPYLSMAWELQRTINDFFDASVRASEALEQLEVEAAQSPNAGQRQAIVAAASEAPIARLVDSLIDGAVAYKASDIHFEPDERGLKVRIRVDGRLLEHAEIPRNQQAAVTARLKVLCIMDITESRRPQDGRLSYDSHGQVLDLRVSSVPTVFGEKLVLRILDKSAVMVPLQNLGFLPDQHQGFDSLIRQPHGMILVVGPTGSGKSTTLYSALNTVNDSTRNIMTLEDPVEYNIAGLNQVQVNARVGLTFASGLRTFVRQDPDVILVGEIRDRETAEMAVQASLTGHLLLSTLHTNSAVGTIARLVNLGVDPFLIGQSLSGIISQRLVAKVCPHCVEDYYPARDVLDALGIARAEARTIQFKHGVGCRTCHERGYMGRIGVFELLVIDEEIRGLIMRRAAELELQQAAERRGMRSLRESALAAVQAGITTPEEMGRVVLTKEEGSTENAGLPVYSA